MAHDHLTWQLYRKPGMQEMRPYVPGEDLSGVSVSPEDTPGEGGMIARNSANHADQWYVAAEFFRANYVPADSTEAFVERACEALRERGGESPLSSEGIQQLRQVVAGYRMGSESLLPLFEQLVAAGSHLATAEETAGFIERTSKMLAHGDSHPSVARMVHYVAYGTPRGEYEAGAHRAAIITEVIGTDPEFIGLCILNPTGMFFNDRVRYDPDGEPGTWHWPPRV